VRAAGIAFVKAGVRLVAPVMTGITMPRSRRRAQTEFGAVSSSLPPVGN
jgi:hypothetical protein